MVCVREKRGTKTHYFPTVRTPSREVVHHITYMSVSWIIGRMVGMIRLHGWGWFVVTASPTFDLIFAEFQYGFFFVLSDQISVRPFIQSPMFVHGYIFLMQFHQD